MFRLMFLPFGRHYYKIICYRLMLLPCVIMSLANVRPMICGRCYATRADVISHFDSICSMAGVTLLHYYIITYIHNYISFRTNMATKCKMIINCNKNLVGIFKIDAELNKKQI